MGGSTGLELMRGQATTFVRRARMSENGNGQLDWLDRTRVYAALAEREDLQEVRVLLASQGLKVGEKALAVCQRAGHQKVERMRQSGLAAALLGCAGLRQSRVQRMDGVCRRLEERLTQEEPELDRDLASVLQQYRELMQYLNRLETGEAQGEPSGEGRRQAEATVTLLEALNNEGSPGEDLGGAVYDAARRLAAATGGTFKPIGPEEPALAGDTSEL